MEKLWKSYGISFLGICTNLDEREKVFESLLPIKLIFTLKHENHMSTCRYFIASFFKTFLTVHVKQDLWVNILCFLNLEPSNFVTRHVQQCLDLVRTGDCLSEVSILLKRNNCIHSVQFCYRALVFFFHPAVAKLRVVSRFKILLFIW